MKKTTYGIIISIALVLGTTGCSESDIREAIDNYKEDDKSSAAVVSSTGTIMYNDGSIMGVTRAEAIVNGGFQIYHIGTGAVVGFIEADSSVNDISGKDLGVCTGVTVSDTGVLGNCILPTPNPNKAPVVVQSVPQPTAQPQPTTTTSNTSGSCPDTRNGDFDPSYSPAVCNANGYFWCSIAKECLDKPINVPECGEIWER